MKKTSRKKAATPRTKAATPARRGALVDSVVDELRQQLGIVTARRRELQPGGFDRDLAATAAQLGKVILTAEAQRAKRDRDRRRELSRIPLREIIDYLLTLPGGPRHEVINALDVLDDEGPLL